MLEVTASRSFEVSSLPPAPMAPTQEIESRLTSFRRAMMSVGLEIVVLSDRKNIEYFTGYRTLSWAYKARPVFVGISPDEVILFGAPTERKVIEFQNPDLDHRYYDGYLEEAISVICVWARTAVSGRPGRVGIDYGQDMLGRGSLSLVEGLRAASSDQTLASAVDAIWQVRLVKSPFEVNQKRTALGIVDRAFDQTIKHAHLGVREYELCQQLQAQIFLNGAESADPIAMLFSKGDFAYGRPPSKRRLEEGHYIWTDFRATYGGYPADRNRIARAGRPSDWEVETYTKVRNLTHALARGTRSDMTCADLFKDFECLWANADLGPIYGAVSRIGHGGGLDVTEPPSVSRDDKTVLRPGMILHLEPKLEKDGAVFQFEEVILVTESEPEFLCDLSPANLPIIEN